MRFDEFRASRGEHDPILDKLTEAIIGACIEVHRILGPGLAERFYEVALCHELELRGIRFARQVPVSVVYKNKEIGETIIDLIVEDQVIVELKACESLNAVHRAQVICYLQIKKLKVGLLVNFNVGVLHDGVKRIVLTK